jgi:transcriptional regulator with XRE-family HTH domain
MLGFPHSSAMPSLFPERYREFLARLTRARTDAGVTQIELAKRFAGYTQSDISRVERGDRRLDFVETVLWLQALGLSPSEFAQSLADHFEAQLLSQGRGRKRSTSTNQSSDPSVAYRDGDRTWSGRGRKPLWIRAAEAQGLSLEQFKVVPRRKAK